MLNYAAVARKIGHHRLIGIGEATHGSHEFFEAKAQLFKHFVQHYGFNVLFFELVDDHCADLTTYLRSGKGDLTKLINSLFYVYRSHEIYDLFVWLRAHYQDTPVEIIGLDERKYAPDYAKSYDLKKQNVRDKRMANVIKRQLVAHPGSKGMIWAHDFHVAAYMNAPLSFKDQSAPMGRHLRRWYGRDYYTIAQLFGDGQFNAALIEESGASDHSVMVAHTIDASRKEFLEYHLRKHLSQPTFLEGPTYGGLIMPDQIYRRRSFGWGIKRSQLNDSGYWMDMSRAYDGVLFFPYARASHHL